jgi:hypothetical protein
MKIINFNSYLDGGTVVITCDNQKTYYVDNRLKSKTTGEVFDAYPPAGKIISKSELWDLVKTVKDSNDIAYTGYILKLLGTA